MAGAAWLYDGESAIRHEVEVGRSGRDLSVRFGDSSSAAVPADRLTYVESRRDCVTYGRSDAPGWRLTLFGDVPEDLAAILPSRQRYGRWIDRVGLVPAALIGMIVSGAVLFAGSKVPEWAAPHVPREWEQELGDALVGDFGGRFCAGEGGQAALDKLAARLSPDAASLNIRVVDIDIVNAAALPGGNIVIFEELLAESDGPDEVAGILAHEISHIERHHVTQMMIRELGLGLVISAFGGTTGANVDALLAARYSRGAEREADSDAAAKLARAGISPLPTAAFFRRLADQERKLGAVGRSLSYVSTHPMSEERQKTFRDSARRDRRYAAALSRDEWEALFNICFNDRTDSAPAPASANR
jgi:beta-barrel assembly-enhancing protease